MGVNKVQGPPEFQANFFFKQFCHLVKATKVIAGLAESNGRLLLGIWRDSLHVTYSENLQVITAIYDVWASCAHEHTLKERLTSYRTQSLQDQIQLARQVNSLNQSPVSARSLDNYSFILYVVRRNLQQECDSSTDTDR